MTKSDVPKRTITPLHKRRDSEIIRHIDRILQQLTPTRRIRILNLIVDQTNEEDSAAPAPNTRPAVQRLSPFDQADA